MKIQNRQALVERIAMSLNRFYQKYSQHPNALLVSEMDFERLFYEDGEPIPEMDHVDFEFAECKTLISKNVGTDYPIWALINFE